MISARAVVLLALANLAPCVDSAWSDQRLAAAASELARREDPTLRLDAARAWADRRRFDRASELLPGPAPTVALRVAAAAALLRLGHRDQALAQLDDPQVAASPQAAAAARMRRESGVAAAAEAWRALQERFLAHRRESPGTALRTRFSRGEDAFEATVRPGLPGLITLTCRGHRLSILAGQGVSAWNDDGFSGSTTAALWLGLEFSITIGDDGGIACANEVPMKMQRSDALLENLAQNLPRVVMLADRLCWAEVDGRWHGSTVDLAGVFAERIDFATDDMRLQQGPFSLALSLIPWQEAEVPPATVPLAGSAGDLLEDAIVPWFAAHAGPDGDALAGPMVRTILFATYADAFDGLERLTEECAELPLDGLGDDDLVDLYLVADTARRADIAKRLTPDSPAAHAVADQPDAKALIDRAPSPGIASVRAWLGRDATAGRIASALALAPAPFWHAVTASLFDPAAALEMSSTDWDEVARPVVGPGSESVPARWIAARIAAWRAMTERVRRLDERLARERAGGAIP